jgi:pimeloyl-ACP methyl ester carboxylesterase
MPGCSEDAPTPRDGEHIAGDLRALPRSRDRQPPYVLVGRSLGGLYSVYFARRHPDAVAAMVLADSTHPSHPKGTEARKNCPAWFRLLDGATASQASKQERDAAAATAEAVLALPPLTGEPVIVLSATEPGRADTGIEQDVISKRKDIARLFPSSERGWIQGGHAMPQEGPQAVIDAIRGTPARTRPAVPGPAAQ